MKRQRWDLRGRKWEQVNVPEILFLSKQDVLWCFIYKATKAQKAEVARLAAKSTVRGYWQQREEEGVGRCWERWREGEGDRWYSIRHRGRCRDMKTDRGNGEQTKADRGCERNEVWCRPEENRELEGERGVQCGTAVVTMANAARRDVSLAAELS